MQDYTPKKADESGSVNADISEESVDFTAWDHKPGDPERTDSHDFRTKEDRRLGEYFQPSSYEHLAEDEKAALQEWIAKELRPSKSEGRLGSYPLKHVYQRLERRYVTEGQFKGGMLVAGYKPLDRAEPCWRFRYKTTDPNLYDRSIGRIGGREEVRKRRR